MIVKFSPQLIRDTFGIAEDELIELKIRVFTIGYFESDIENLKRFIFEHDALFIDLRRANKSKRPELLKDYLLLLLRGHYRKILNLTNRSENSEKHEIQNLTLGIKTILSFQKNLVLFCDCREFDKCHRKLISEQLKSFGCDVREVNL